MIQNTEPKVKILYNESLLAELFEALDQMHTAASEGELHLLTTCSQRELIAWLRELAYTAEETIQEIDQHYAYPEVVLRLVEKPVADQSSA